MSPVPSSSYSTPYSSPGEPYNTKSLKSDIDDDDRHSSHSDASSASRAEKALETLRQVAGDRVRHAACSPEFLDDIASKGTYTHLSKVLESKFKVIAGAEAKSYFHHYTGKHTESRHTRNHDDEFTNDESSPSGTVFAVTVRDQHNRTRCVDYYMTWRSHTKSSHNKGMHMHMFNRIVSVSNQQAELEDRISFLDAEFRRLSKGLDREFKRMKSLGKHQNLSGSSPKGDKQSLLNEGSPRFKIPPGITISSPDDDLEKLDDPKLPPFPRPPLSATDSVMSLPNLTFMRNVPGSHQLKLRITNPDRNSMMSGEVTPVESRFEPTRLQTLAEQKNNSYNDASLSVPRKRRENNLDSSASIRSIDTNTSASSRSSRSSSPTRPSGKRYAHDSKSSRLYNNETCPFFLLVVLGDRLDIDHSSWHGLQHHASIRTVPAERHSPWMGPLAGANTFTPPRLPSVYNPTAAGDDGSSDDEDDSAWYNHNAPVIPLKPMMESMGMIPKSYYASPAVVPAGLPYHFTSSTMATPGPHQSPYLYSSPRLDASPYTPWIPPLPAMSVTSSRHSGRTYNGAPFSGSYVPSSHSGHY